MKLSEAADHEPNTVYVPMCSIRSLFEQLSDEDATTLQELMDDPLVTNTRISRALKRIGHQVGDTTISRHRRKACKCESL